MTALRFALVCVGALGLSAACGSSDEDSGSGGKSGSGGGGTGGSTGGAAGVGGAAGSAGTGGAAGSGPLSISLPQTVDGALLANPSVYAQVPLHIDTTGNPDQVEVDFDGKTVTASDPEKDGSFVAELPLTGLADGLVKLSAHASRAGQTPVSADAEMVIANTGVRITENAKVGMAATPRLHRVNDALWLTWRDRTASNAGIYLRRLDGGARFSADAVTLIDPSVNALYARTVFGKTGIGILYQTLGNPYVNHFEVVDPTGKELVPSIDLDPPGTYGLSGGDVAFDGTGFVFVWRISDGTKQEVRWARVEESGGALTGPLVVAQSGNDDPNGGFPGFVPLGVRTIGDKSLVSFVRERWDGLLAMAIPKSQLALVSNTGSVTWSAYAGKESDWTFHHEARVFSAHGSLVSIWSANDLSSPENNPPNVFFGTKTDAQGELDPNRGAGAVVVDAPDDRGDPFLLEHPQHFALLAWLDHRSYAGGISQGKIELYVAPLADDLSSGTPTVFGHARFIAGTSELNAAPAGTNAMLTWIDERNGKGILDPKAEIWIDTAWY